MPTTDSSTITASWAAQGTLAAGSINVTFGDTTAGNTTSFTASSASGTFTYNGNTYSITGIDTTSASNDAANNVVYNSQTAGHGFVDNGGVTFIVSGTPAINGTAGATSPVPNHVNFFWNSSSQGYSFDFGAGPGEFGGPLLSVQNPALGSVSQSSFAVCYAAGTLIRTPRGDIPVEELQVGDLVVTASGAQRPIVWLGHSKVRFANHENPRAVWPIRIAAGAFGAHKPSRDLFVSPAHSICVDCVGEVMINAKQLVNGSTITREEAAQIDYWHVELETHDVLLANNLPAESYLAMGNREFFLEHEGLDRGSAFGEAEFCRPRANDGPVLAAVRAQLEARAQQLGYSRKTDPEARLVVDGAEHPALQGEGLVLFLLPRAAQEVRLVTSACIPADHICENEDTRRLGLCVHGLSLSDGRRLQEIALDDPRLDEAFFPLETENGRRWRWSKSEAALPATLWEGFAGTHVALSIACDTTERRGWTAPPRAEEQDEAVRPAPRLYAVG